jgi:hypothetical protein
MKTKHGGWREEYRQDFVHDAYKQQKKLPEPTRCPDCGAVFREGRWQWAMAPAGAHEALCPACHRIRDRYPAGYVTLEGAFFAAHRDDILHLVRNREIREKSEHPLERIMAIEDVEGACRSRRPTRTWRAPSARRCMTRTRVNSRSSTTRKRIWCACTGRADPARDRRAAR